MATSSQCPPNLLGSPSPAGGGRVEVSCAFAWPTPACGEALARGEQVSGMEGPGPQSTGPSLRRSHKPVMVPGAWSSHRFPEASPTTGHLNHPMTEGMKLQSRKLGV